MPTLWNSRPYPWEQLPSEFEYLGVSWEQKVITFTEYDVLEISTKRAVLEWVLRLLQLLPQSENHLWKFDSFKMMQVKRILLTIGDDFGIFSERDIQERLKYIWAVSKKSMEEMK